MSGLKAGDGVDIIVGFAYTLKTLVLSINGIRVQTVNFSCLPETYRLTCRESEQYEATVLGYNRSVCGTTW